VSTRKITIVARSGVEQLFGYVKKMAQAKAQARCAARQGEGEQSAAGIPNNL